MTMTFMRIFDARLFIEISANMYRGMVAQPILGSFHPYFFKTFNFNIGRQRYQLTKACAWSLNDGFNVAII